MTHRLLQQTDLMKAEVLPQLSPAKGSGRREFDVIFTLQITFNESDYVGVDRPPQHEIASNAAEKTANSQHNILLT